MTISGFHMTSVATLSLTLGYIARRLAAYVIDALLLLAGVLVTQAIIYTLGVNPIANRLAAGESVAGWQLHLWVFATVSLPFWIYYAGLHSSAWQATIGKRLMGLRVVSTTGARLKFGRALWRAILVLIPFEWNHIIILQLAPLDGAPPSPMFWAGNVLTWVLILIYLGLPFFNPLRQSVHDVLAQTYVSRIE